MWEFCRLRIISWLLKGARSWNSVTELRLGRLADLRVTFVFVFRKSSESYTQVWISKKLTGVLFGCLRLSWVSWKIVRGRWLQLLDWRTKDCGCVVSFDCVAFIATNGFSAKLGVQILEPAHTVFCRLMISSWILQMLRSLSSCSTSSALAGLSMLSVRTIGTIGSSTLEIVFCD